ncbi:MAG: ATP phosphoribosyltransferase regulatory subunit [Bauldia litoralis]
MTDANHTALLPPGMRDILPPDGAHAATIVEKLRASFARWGYQWVKPPLIEFETSLLNGAGAAMAGETFRLMDPVSQQMMGIRADITLQIARIAATRLRNEPRPLRLSYYGDVLRVRGKQLRPERQFTQIGAELIGTGGSAADAEVVLMAASALADLGVTDLSIDLTFPTLVPNLCAAFGIDGQQLAALRAALDSKDSAAVALAAGAEHAALFQGLLQAAGPLEPGLAKLSALDLPEGARGEAARLSEVANHVRETAPELTLTLDPIEFRGFEYHTGLSFTIFRRGVRGEVGSGGRYVAGRDIEGRDTEPATGFTLYLDTILRALPAPARDRLLYLPHGTSAADAARWRADGWAAIAALVPGDADSEARRLGCSHLLRDGAPVALTDE